MTTENELQFQVEAERSMATLEQAISTMEQFGGNVHMFSYAMLLASVRLFAEVRGFPELEKAIPHLLHREQQRHQPCGRA
ncbi:hypothetical protein SL1157_2144 [Ruegeria lacuscaerulensis ITI-1157]|nr:hypothetical protein SL1157_2144 [Ruegeria lacuscaerulensis ITI-1157]SHI96068.1 hypothetical protein SAMN05444404_1096 [Ruegeria lacuscaerulensis ITI-1157]